MYIKLIVILVICLFPSFGYSNSETIKWKGLCVDGELEACKKLEKHFLLSKKSISYIQFSYQSCQLGDEFSCDLLFKYFVDIFSKLFVSFALFLYVFVYRKMRPCHFLIQSIVYLFFVFTFYHFLCDISVILFPFMNTDTAKSLTRAFIMIPCLLELVRRGYLPFKFKVEKVACRYIGLIYFLSIFFILFSIVYVVKLGLPDLTDVLVYQSLDSYEGMWIFVTGVLVIPFFVELVFRGILFNMTKPLESKVFLLLLFHSTVYAMLYFESLRFPLFFILGGMSSYIMLKTKNFTHVFLFHVFIAFNRWMLSSVELIDSSDIVSLKNVEGLTLILLLAFLVVGSGAIISKFK